ncbi:MAG: hypothetical protein M3014_04835 [Chloroflexota bacterium]|nr:hypothetical protein [Chloroflexota bacterium]
MTAKKIVQDEFEIAQDEGAETAVEQGGAEEKAMTKNGEKAFDPSQYMSKFDGKDYLEVKWRLLWLRTEHPDARMTTEIVQHNEEGGFALFRAEIEVPAGGKATGWGSETVRDFHDYIEAAETKALGRALAALGYGTQFCQDFDFAANARPGTTQVVDAPVAVGGASNVVRSASFGGNGNAWGKASTFSIAQKSAGYSDGGRAPAEEDEFDRLPVAEISPNGSAATEKQVKAIYAIGRASKRLSESQVDDRSTEVFGVKPAELTKAEASQFIDLLKGEAAA